LTTQEFVKACGQGNVQKVKECIAKGLDVNGTHFTMQMTDAAGAAKLFVRFASTSSPSGILQEPLLGKAKSLCSRRFTATTTSKG
jgi:hypothetical protein